MPGDAVKFEDKTLLLISGNSGIGKTTLANFLSDERSDIYHLKTDSFFTSEFLKKNKINHSKYKESLKILESEKDPSLYISSVIDKMNKNFLLSLTSHIIKEKFKEKGKKLKLIIVEGFLLKSIHGKLAKKFIKDEYRVWNVDLEK